MTDVVVVGGGVAGSALAVQLARGGIAVTVLERTEEFPDRVRGETIPPWGYVEVADSGLLDVVMQAEGSIATRYVSYGDAMSVEQAEATALDATSLVPGARGSLNVSHPGACQALLEEAERAGAHVVRGVSDIRVAPGSAPQVSYRMGAQTHELTPRLVVGADGRSSVVRKQIGARLQHSGVRTFACGVLLDAVDGWPVSTNSTGTWDDVYFLLFPRQGGRLRLYLLWDKDDPQRFAGPDGTARMIERVSTLPCLPDPAIFEAAVPVPGSTASYPMEDTWCDRPFTDGVVLVGDAAGWNDPIIGQGLSIAFRDARLVAEAVLASSTWDTQAFEPYGEERAERLRRLRATADAVTRLRAEFGPEARRRREIVYARFAQDPTSRLPIAAALLGPHSLPAHAFTRQAADQMLAV